MNVKLLKQIRKDILKYPEQFHMASWFNLIPTVPRCGTTACIAGWAVTRTLDGDSPRKAIQKLNRLIPGCAKIKGYELDAGADFSSIVTGLAMAFLQLEHAQADKLFHVRNWPKDWQEKYYGGPLTLSGTKRRAKVTAQRIDFFIKTQGTDQPSIL